MDNQYVEDSTDIESMPDIPPRKSKVKHLSDSWMLSQRQQHEPQTDGSELEDFIMEVPKVIPNVKISSYNSKCSVTENKDKKKGVKKGKKKSIPVQAVRGDDTDDEHIDITAKDLQDIIQEAMDSRGKHKLFLKTHDTSIIYRSQSKHDEVDQESDDTDCSDVDVSMMDYYAIRHANQSTIHSKSVKRSSVYKNFTDQIREHPDTEEEDTELLSKREDDNDSDVSELEVNMKDYYVIRHETAPKFVAGPFEIDFGNTTQSSILKKPPTTGRRRNSIPLSYGKEDERLTDDEELPCLKDDLMTYQDYRTNADLRSYQHESMICQGGSKELNESGSESEESEEESCESSNSDSLPTECNSEDLSNMMLKPKTKPPIIRLIEIEGCQGTVGVLCAPRSPTKDAVHGIRFIEGQGDISEVTESLMEDDLSVMASKAYDPATDNEEISDLEYDQQQPTKTMPSYALPEMRKTVKSIKTSHDGKTMLTENQIKLDEPVSLIEFVQETENLSESDVCDWSEQEVQIVRRLSGDFGRNKKLLEPKPEVKKNGIPKKPGRKSSKETNKPTGKYKLDETVTLTQFVQEVEKLSESDVSDWPEEEIKIVRRLSGDFGKNQPLLNVEKLHSQSMTKLTPSPVHKPKRTGRNRRRGKKKSGNNDSGQNKVAN